MQTHTNMYLYIHNITHRTTNALVSTFTTQVQWCQLWYTMQWTTQCYNTFIPNPVSYYNNQISKHHNKPSNAFAWHHVKPTESHTCNQNDSNTKTFIQNNSSHDTIVTKSTHIHNIQVKEAHSSHHIPHRTFNSALSKHCIPAHCRHCSHCRHWNSHAKWQNVYYNNMLTPIRTQHSH